MGAHRPRGSSQLIVEPTEAASPLPDTHSSCCHHQHASPGFCLLSRPARPAAPSVPKPTLLTQSWGPHAGAAPQPARSPQTLCTPCRRWHRLLAAPPHVSWNIGWTKGSQPPEAFGERSRDWSPGHTGDEGPQVAMTGEARGCSRAAAPEYSDQCGAPLLHQGLYFLQHPFMTPRQARHLNSNPLVCLMQVDPGRYWPIDRFGSSISLVQTEFKFQRLFSTIVMYSLLGLRLLLLLLSCFSHVRLCATP